MLEVLRVETILLKWFLLCVYGLFTYFSRVIVIGGPLVLVLHYGEL